MKKSIYIIIVILLALAGFYFYELFNNKEISLPKIASKNCSEFTEIGIYGFDTKVVTDGSHVFFYTPEFVDGFSGITTPEKCEKLEDADPETFEIMPGPSGYSKDKNNVYYISKKIEGVDPESAYIISGYYSTFLKDSKGVYYENKKIIGADPKTFEVISNTYRKDKNNVYYGSQNKVVEGADPETFEVISTYEGKDKDNFYYQDKIK